MLSFVSLVWPWCLFVFMAFHNSLAMKTERPLCSPDNLSFQNTSSGEFLLMNDGSFRYHMDHCHLRRFKAPEAAKCLRGTHILFAGDSLSRYFYITLASLFALGRWPLHFVSSYPNGLSFLSEKEYHNWSWFFSATNRALNNRARHAFEVCDCFRNDTAPFEVFIRDMFENRHFRHLPDGEWDDGNDVRLSYIQWWGNMPIRGHKDISLKIPQNRTLLEFLDKMNAEHCPLKGQKFWPLSRNCSDQRKDLHAIDFPQWAMKDDCQDYPKPTINPYSKEEMCSRFEEQVLGPLKVTHVLLNTGWHAGLEHIGPNFLPKLVDFGGKFLAPVPPTAQVQNLPQIVWRESTKGAYWELQDEVARKERVKLGADKLGYFPVGEITAKLQTIEHMLINKLDSVLQKTVKVNSRWPSDRDVNSTTIHRIWHDPAHFEPWVYTEINNLFLNAICPLAHAT